MRSAALVTVTMLVAGCSADATRLQDGFYTGAIPKAPVQQQTQMAAAAPSYGAGQPNASYGSGTTGPSQTYAVATGPVSRSTLPPPPAASYGDGGYPAAAPASAPMASSPVGSQQVAQTSAARGLSASEPARSQPVRSASAGSITVTSGDSVLGLARRNGVSAAELRRANGLSDDNIRIGQVLTIPGGASAPAQQTRVATLGAPPTTLQAQAKAIPSPRVAPPAPAVAAAAKPAPTLATVTPVKPAAPAHTAPVASQPAVAAAPTPATPAKPEASSSAIAAAAPAPATTVAAEEKQEEASIAPKSTGIDEFRWPVQGRVVKNFGDKVGSRRNDGLNISVPRGTPVKAAENGVVIYAGEGLKEFGKTVLIKHDNGLVTVYGHADDILVQRGATVKRGQEIAKAGMTGETDVPIVHFEVRKDSSPVNPMTYLR
ncbi:M23 family metallopeptidase [Aureimonas pseudogalii]|uniref:Murein DD-endopeptidase MepM/ murein hydrolase activator NlpD n=1 Tax=Aureimonas pseudogalii TaxID=1744844 RepID=A0A7W6MKN8_9HYPH|nr:M23 family metallopeptidase [Aureimonas pseudogalii]MBB3999133.1 murein DD-endopeptidase MepM/ murein hydrolase activator NlpD [Aureimonas pseudogalii]